MNTTRLSIVKLSLAAAGLVLASHAALACTTDNWSLASGAVTPGDPAADGIARYSGLCGLEATGQGFVQDNSPGGIDRIVARFYVLNNNTATANIYSGFGATDGTGQRFSVTLDNTGEVTLTDNVSGQSVSQAGTTNWLSVEIDWGQGASSGFISLSVNGQAAGEISGLSNSGPALQSVRLGNLDGAAGTLTFDSYESRRSTAVGRLCPGKTTGVGDRTSDDFLEIFDEVASAGGVLASGQPDFNEDGVINTDDVLGVFDLVAGAAGECP